MIGTIIGSLSVWMFLIVFTLTPLSYIWFGDQIDLADTPAKSHKILRHVKAVNKFMKLLALCIFALELKGWVSTGLQSFCEARKIYRGEGYGAGATKYYPHYTPDDWEYPGSCLVSLGAVGTTGLFQFEMMESLFAASPGCDDPCTEVDLSLCPPTCSEEAINSIVSTVGFVLGLVAPFLVTYFVT